MEGQLLHRTIGRPLDEPLSTFELGKALQDLKAEGWLERGGRNSIILHKQGGLKVVLVAMRAGNRIDAHKVLGPITVQVLEGAIRFRAEDHAVRLCRGELLTLHGGMAHGVEALEDAAFLLTIAGDDEH